MIIFFIRWVTKTLGVPKEKVKVRLQLYQDMNEREEIRYWSQLLHIDEKQFSPSYIKKSESIRINHKGSFGHGTCNVHVNNARLAEKDL